MSANVSEVSARRLLDATPDGILVCDQSGQILFVNRQVETVSGYAAAELTGSHVEILVPHSFRVRHERHREGYRASGFPPRTMGSGLDILLRRKDGREVAVDVALSPLEADGATLVVAAIRDATERRRAERAAREQALLLELTHECILLRSFEDSRIVFWNQGAVETYGFSRTEAQGAMSHTLLRTVFPVSREEVERELAQAGRWEGELRHTRKDGAELIVSSRQVMVRDVGGRAVSILESNRDVTDQRRAQALVEASYTVTQAVLSRRLHEDILRVVADRARGLAGADFAAVATGEPGSGRLVVRVAVGREAERALGTELPVPEPLRRQVLDERRTVAVEGLRPGGRRGQRARAPGAETALLVPLAAGEQLFGVLALDGRAPLTPRQRSDLEQFATAAAVAVEYNRLRDELQRLAVLEDRERIARDLHDGAIQSLFSVGMALQGLAARSLDADTTRRAQSAVDEIDRVIRELRTYIFGLRPTLLAGHMAEALGRLVSDFETRSGVVTVLDVDPRLVGSLGSRGPDVLKLATEALSNVGRHAQATTCRVSLHLVDGAAVLEVDDDGRGFDVANVSAAGHGLRNFSERASQMSGQVEIVSSPGEGTTVRVTIPV